ncbi:FecR family protein [Aquamicrobium sp. LC103]|uniref:FecR family protein n=1 Tax=Aquamicrobium sp. LC103 TaxID=1120658 RepID=UPI001FEE6E7B|nr:FecR family protein [Aquamicrobium sp. LC103]
MTRQDETQEILEEAMDWFLRLRAGGGGAEEREFALWLSRSAAHREAWEKAGRTWEAMGEVPAAHQHLWRRRGQAPAPAAGRRRRIWGAGLGAALAASLVLGLAGPSVLLAFRADHRTETAELRTVALEDGSTVELGAASAIETDFSAEERRVTLLSGEAFFDVSRDPARPFTVEAGGIRVAVIGTAFDVRLSETQTTVQLARGVVGISVAGASAVTTELSPGEMAIVAHADGSITRRNIAPEDIAAWRDGRLFVDDVTIAEVVEELRRYHGAWIGIADSTLAGRRVTGLYDLTDPDRALEALVEPHGGKVHRVSAYLRVVAPF